MNNIKIGDTVKVIGMTNCGGEEKELIPIGTICKVVEMEDDPENGMKICGIVEVDKSWANSSVCAYYYDKDLEKGKLMWVKG